MRRKGIRLHLLLGLVILLALVALGCGSTGGMNEGDGDGGDGGDDGTPTEQVETVTVTPGKAGIYADGVTQTRITATVSNASDQPLSRSVPVEFTTTKGTVSPSTVQTENGVAQAMLTSSEITGTATVTAVTEGVSGQTSVEFQPVPQSFALSYSQNTVKSDNSDSSMITAILLDKNRVPIPGITVNFSVDGGQLSAASAVTTVDVTDDQAKAQVRFSAGEVNASNRTVTITAEVQGLPKRILPIQIVGSAISLSTEKTNLDVEKAEKDTLKILAQDAGLNPVYDTEVTATVIPGDPSDPNASKGDLSLASIKNGEVSQTDVNGVLTDTTDVNGELIIEVRGKRAGEATIRVEAVGDTKTQVYTISSVAETFTIISPEEDLVGVSTDQSLPVQVRSPNGESVRFSTTFGTWENGRKVIDVPVQGNRIATASLSSAEAGLASIQVFESATDQQGATDSMQAAFYAPLDTASNLSLQASSNTIKPSTGDTVNTLTISATVKNASDQVVGNAPVAFSLSNTTGGGESISPVIVYTNSSGVATTTFSSGSLSSGGEGVEISAEVLGSSEAVTDTLRIIIGGTAGSVVIGQSTDIQSVANDTAYELPMSVVVSDANGNPVPGAKVTLSSWPNRYATGFWTAEPCLPVVTGKYPNEDANRNLILDEGEDLPPNADGRLTPPNSAAGTVSGTSSGETGSARSPRMSARDDDTYIVQTDNQGVAKFYLTYLKSSAVWIESEITASTMVSGSETQSKYPFWLPYLKEDACELPDSPYNGTSQVEYSLNILADPMELKADGVSTSTIRAVVKDPSGNPVEDGTVVAFEILSGSGSFSFANKINSETEEGMATANYQASTEGGTVTIQASLVDGNASDTVDLRLLEVDIGSINLSVDKDTGIPADGNSSATITAELKSSTGEAMPRGTPITFTTNKGTFANGSKTYSLETANAQGTLSVALIADNTPGTAEITGKSGGVSQKITLKFLGDDTTAPPATISLNIQPAIAPADGSTSVDITATIKNSTGQSVPTGTPVTFRTDRGAFPNGGQSFSTTTANDQGIVYAALIAPTSPGTATVTCEVSGISQAFTVEFTGEQGAQPVATVRLETESGSEQIPADGSSSAQIIATLQDTSGNPIKTGKVLTFTTTLGTFRDGSTSYQVSSFNDKGQATVSLIAADEAGTARVTAISEGISDSTTVEFVKEVPPASPASISLTATPGSLVADGESTATIRAVVLDENNNPLAGQVVNFSADDGILDSLTATTTASGFAEVNFTAPTTEGDDGIAQIEGWVDGTEVRANTQISLFGPTVTGLTLSANLSSIPINGGETVLRAVVTTEAGDSPDGIPVTFSVVQGGGHFGSDPNQQEIAVNTAGGVATATLKSGTQPEEVLIRAAEPGGLLDEMTILYTAGNITLTVNPTTLLSTGTAEQKATVSVLVKDENGDPAAGETVALSLSDAGFGRIEPRSGQTNAQGKMTATFYAADQSGQAVITAEWETVTAQATVTIQPHPAFINVKDGFPTPTAISVKGTGGNATSQIAFEVKNTQGEPVADGYRIDFSILSGPDGGEMLSPIFAETRDGQVSTVLRSGFKSGPVSIKASYFHDSNVSTVSSQIAIVAGQPVGEEFSIAAEYLNIVGLDQMGLEDGLTVNAGDVYGNPIPDNTAISFKTYNTGGLCNPGSANTSSGTAISSLRSTANPSPLQGFVSVTAEAINGGRTTHVTSLAVVEESNFNQILYAGTNGGGVYKSTDSGTTWRNVSRSSSIPGQNWIGPYVNDVAVDPDNTNTVYAATGYLGNGHLYRSLDGGLNWNSDADPEQWYGVFSTNAVVLSVICDQDGPGDTQYVWIGTDGSGVFWSSDGKHFTQSQSAFSLSSVQDIVRVSGTHGENAVLYAGTSTGVYLSEDGGRNWRKTTSFAGNYITSLALYPKGSGRGAGSGNDILYAGTEDAGVWVSTDSGKSWIDYGSGMGKGLSATVPQPSRGNKGTGMMGEVTVYKDAVSEKWTVVYDATDQAFTVTGSVSGQHPDYPLADIQAGTPYSIEDVLEFSIGTGMTTFQTGDRFTFNTTRDPGRSITDLAVDAMNNRLYALTYFFGPQEPHPVGNVYVHELNFDGSMSWGEWKEVTRNLPQYDPPDDTTLFAQHVIEVGPNNFEYPNGVLYIGGEGINFYKATDGIDTGNPSWKESASGLSNLIMARMPVLFSDTCAMDVTVQSVTSRTLDEGEIVYDATFVVYIQDRNGNPPVAGSQFSVVKGTDTVKEVPYLDSHIHTGTFRDPADPVTDIPYVVDVIGITEQDTVTVTFDPLSPCDQAGVPGCPGNFQSINYPYDFFAGF